ncbi:MAG: transposase [Pirellulaceae bacterium]|jgi:transposase
MDEVKHPKRKPRYTEDFKRDAVKLVVVEGHSMLHASTLLGVSCGSVRNWVEEYGPDRDEVVDEHTTVGDLQDEVRRLRKELKQAELEREILKKATAYFAKESQ